FHSNVKSSMRAEPECSRHSIDREGEHPQEQRRSSTMFCYHWSQLHGRTPSSCDHLFDSSSSGGSFSFPILPKSPSSSELQHTQQLPASYSESETTPRPMVVERNMQ
ncbi:hypothetical protein PFISCL1PPCAC_18355, partial [Pristionchus fissidentatus]